MDLQFAGDVLAVRDDRVGGDIEMSGDFLVGHALNEADDDFALALGEGILAFRLAYHFRQARCHAVCFSALLQAAHSGHEQAIFHVAVVGEPLLLNANYVDNVVVRLYTSLCDNAEKLYQTIVKIKD